MPHANAVARATSVGVSGLLQPARPPTHTASTCRSSSSATTSAAPARLEAPAVGEAEQVGRCRGRGAYGVGRASHPRVADDVAHGLVHGERAAGERAVGEAWGTAVEAQRDLADGRPRARRPHR